VRRSGCLPTHLCSAVNPANDSDEGRGPAGNRARHTRPPELTIDRAAQERGERIVDEARQGQPANLRIALVAVDPRTGRVVAWNGYQAEESRFDYARRLRAREHRHRYRW
jgi:hypothetical protein